MTPTPRTPHWWMFIKEFQRTFQTTGALLPTSRFVAREQAKAMLHAAPDALFLEVGPGTGSLTSTYIEKLRPGDRLVLVELNDRFVEILRHRLENDPQWKHKRAQVEIRHGSALDLPAGETYQAIMSALPLNNFDADLVRQFLDLFIARLAPGGKFSFFEYWAIRRLKAPFTSSKERDRLRAVAEVIVKFEEIHEARHVLVTRNFPPVLVHHVPK